MMRAVTLCSIWTLLSVGLIVVLHLFIEKTYERNIPKDVLSRCRYITGSNKLQSELDYILWPSPFSTDNFPCLPSRNQSSCMSLLPRVEPLPRILSPKTKPSCDVVIRSFHGYALFLNILLRSLEIFWPRDMGKIIVILDDSGDDHSYAVTLPDYVTVIFEPLPHFTDLWIHRNSTKKTGLLLSKLGYGRGEWSNFISDRYSSADFIAVFDSDQIISGGGQLQLLFDWDVKIQQYKPIFVCVDNVDLHGSFAYNYKIFGMSGAVGIGCMRSLPVVMYRDTFPKIRKYLVNYFLIEEPSIYNDSRLANVPIDYDRDYNWTQQAKTESSKYSLPTIPTYFDRAFASLDQRCKLCQFCVFGAFIYTHPEESSRYTFKIIGYGKSAEKLKEDQIKLINYARVIDDYRFAKARIQINHTNEYTLYSPECAQIHSGAHIAYMIDTPKLSEEYFKVAERLIDDGLCKVSRPEDCNYQYCKLRGWDYDAVAQRRLYSNTETNISFPQQFYSNQQALVGWEKKIKAPGGVFTCRSFNYAMLHHYFEWEQRFETRKYDSFKLRQCKRQ